MCATKKAGRYEPKRTSEQCKLFCSAMQCKLTAIVVGQGNTSAYAGEPTRPALGGLRLTQQTTASAGGSSRPDLGVLRLTQQTRIPTKTKVPTNRAPRPDLGRLH
eukprot:5215975-Amphidinium_carterae.1